MKKHKIIYLVLIIFLGLISSGCQDFLNEEPQSTWGVDPFYSSTSEAEIALAGIYSVFAADKLYGQTFTIKMASGTDEGYYNRRYNEGWTVGLYRHTASDILVKDFWAELYEAINLSNLFIENLKIETTPEDSTEYKRFIAEARFLRGHSYFLLTSWFNEIPLQLTSTANQESNHLPLSSLEDVYAQIIDDFTYATVHLLHPENPEYVPGKANKMAAHGLLARTYLKMAGNPMNDASKYTLVKDQCDSIISDGYHALNTTDGNGYRNHFLSYIQNVYDTQESLFEISFAYLREMGITVHGRIGALNGLKFDYGAGVDGYPGAYAMLNASPLLKSIYSPDDLRKTWNFAEFMYSGNGDARAMTDPLALQYGPGKYRRWEPANFDDLDNSPPAGVTEPYILLEAVTNPSKNFTSINFPVLRYSDVLLMYAEADNEINGPTPTAISYLNEVRNRAGLGNIEVDTPEAVASKENFFNELVDERSRELCFEALRKQDLIRWGLLGEKLALQNAFIQGMSKFRNTNEQHKSYLRAGNFFDETKHLSLPYPLQEVALNDLLEQKSGW